MEKYQSTLEEKIIKEKIIEYRKEGVNTSSFNADCTHELQSLMDHSNITIFTPIVTEHKLIRPLVIVLKKVIRKLLKWLIEPICIQQSAFNNAVINNFKNEIEIQRNDERYKMLEQHFNELLQVNQKMGEEILNVSEGLSNLTKLNPDLFIESNNFWLDRKTYAQAGEDVILEYVLMVLGITMKECRYLDLGANHAKELSNTYCLYKKGARGVLVEANPQLIPELKFYRYEDVILNKCVAKNSGETVKFYIMNGDGLSSADKDSVDLACRKNKDLEVSNTIEVETISVVDIIDTYFESAPDIINIDIEGKDVEILEQLDLVKGRPLLIVIEMIEYNPLLTIGEKNEVILNFMEEHDYKEYAFTGINSIFIDYKKLT